MLREIKIVLHSMKDLQLILSLMRKNQRLELITVLGSKSFLKLYQKEAKLYIAKFKQEYIDRNIRENFTPFAII